MHINTNILKQQLKFIPLSSNVSYLGTTVNYGIDAHTAVNALSNNPQTIGNWNVSPQTHYINSSQMESECNAIECSNSIEASIDFDFYKALFDPVRSKILVYIASSGKKRINEIAENFTQNRSVISRHLDFMSRYGIVSKTKINRHVFYEVNSTFILDKFEETTENLKRLMKVTKPI
ncbi:ArsR/SmtB family transcription factor [Clostridium sp. WILCCON 0269]|uniref:ArsR/SmtB family transcription factor n=1 Tax=Candidatus Clostridium eludens TaxID=3381663 RepID=A0ABW8SRS5_9CLOT